MSNESKLEDPLYIDANYTYTSNTLDLKSGIIYFYINDYEKLVFEIKDEFIPNNQYDIGGISVIEGNRVHNLYEYENPEENINYNYIRVTKIINHFLGDGSEDGIIWHDRGSKFIKNAEVIGITYEEQNNLFPINEIKIYRDPSWYIHGLYEGYVLKIYNEDESELLYDIIVDNTDIVKITDKFYPINCKIKIWDNENNQILESLLTNIWGGDEYYISIDIDLYNKDRILLYLEEAKHIGIVKFAKPLKELIYIVNNSINDILVTVRIAEESPAYNWIELEYLGIRDKQILIPLSALGEDEFNIIITQPSYDDILPTDYATGEEYLFYLEVL